MATPHLAMRRSSVLALVLIGVCGTLLRLLVARTASLHVDEAGNILTSIDETFRTAIDPLGLGRPLLAFIFRPAGLFSASDPVFVSRLLSIVAAVISLLSIAWAAFRLAGERAAVIAAVLWAFAPQLIIHDARALQESFGSSLLLLSIVAAAGIGGSESRSALQTFGLMLSGLLWGLAFANKITAVLSLIWWPAVFWTLLVPRQRRMVFALKGALLFSLGAVLSISASSFPLVHLGETIARTNHSPLNGTWQVLGGLARVRDVFLQYNGYAAGLGLVLAIFASLEQRRLALLRYAVIAAIAAEAAIYSNVYFGRYSHQTLIPVVLLVSSVSAEAPANVLRALYAAVIALALSWSASILRVSLSPDNSSWCPITATNSYVYDYCQYSAAWPSGRGLNELVGFLKEKASAKPLLLFSSNNFSSTGNGPLLLLKDDQRIKVLLRNDQESELPAIITADAGACFLAGDCAVYVAVTEVPSTHSKVDSVFSFGRSAVFREAFRYEGTSGRYSYVILELISLAPEQVLAELPPSAVRADSTAAPKVELPVRCPLQSSGISIQAVRPGIVRAYAGDRLFEEAEVDDRPFEIDLSRVPQGTSSIKIEITNWVTEVDPLAHNSTYRNRTRLTGFRDISHRCGALASEKTTQSGGE